MSECDTTLIVVTVAVEEEGVTTTVVTVSVPRSVGGRVPSVTTFGNSAAVVVASF